MVEVAGAVRRLIMQHIAINSVRSHALFVSALQPSDDPGTEQVRQAISGAVRQFGSRGCAGRMAQEFGDHPEAAVARMRWARQIVAETFEASPAWVSHTRPVTASRTIRVAAAA
ncbi:MAG TPA: hypothetical protein VGJ63_12795 [Micromonosporaceae bacterium]